MPGRGSDNLILPDAAAENRRSVKVVGVKKEEESLYFATRLYKSAIL